ncbi:retropepsin-like aspartic peptidase RloA2 [Stutzerimonas tarimensis]|uniref:ATP-dependent zinc protease n=1 Tax=Stutzerimonas tarimensis TaxID=1507735 RepID=A0ABV7T5C5_9GAMM
MLRTSALLGLLSLAVATTTVAQTQPHLYGRYENIRLDQLGKTLKAKMDTGAMTASLSARDIERFERDGEDWVRFRLAIEGMDDTLYEQPMVRISQIKTRAEERSDPEDDTDIERGADMAERPVIEMELCIGDRLIETEVNLTDRSRFTYPLLVGATALRQLDAAVYSTQKYTAGRPDC